MAEAIELPSTYFKICDAFAVQTVGLLNLVGAEQVGVCTFAAGVTAIVVSKMAAAPAMAAPKACPTASSNTSFNQGRCLVSPAMSRAGGAPRLVRSSSEPISRPLFPLSI